MEKIVIEGKSGRSEILVGESLANLTSYIPLKKVFIITDKNVFGHYAQQFPDFPVYIADPGENSKDFSTVALIYKWLLDEGADRSSFIVGIGGGVVCDIAGYVAATFMRGIPFGFVATSLLAQVDASVGGKNGINLHGYKNIIGTFTQPRFVICDTTMLATLPEEEYRNGMAEVIKHALIRDEKKFDYLLSAQNLLNERQPEAVNSIVSQSVKIKASIVQADELERGERRLLNFGHTWGHAVEKVARIPHGQAVAVGMVFASGFSVFKGLLEESERKKILDLIAGYNLPLHYETDIEKVYHAMLKDKKKEQDTLHFIFLNRIGHAVVKEISAGDVQAYLEKHPV